MAIHVTLDLPATRRETSRFLACAGSLGADHIDKDGPRLITRIEVGAPDAEERAVGTFGGPLEDRDATRARAAAGI